MMNRALLVAFIILASLPVWAQEVPRGIDPKLGLVCYEDITPGADHSVVCVPIRKAQPKAPPA
jgi:hypothetical protein